MLARLLSLTAALLLTIACGRADANALHPKTAHRGFAAIAATASGQIALASLEAIKEKVAAAGDRTSSLLLGEQFDPNLGFYYLRARYMDPSNGRFVSQDSYMGADRDPVSLHKYLYANGNPVMGIDPSGNMTLGEAMTSLNTLSNLYTAASLSFNLLTGNYGVAGVAAKEIVEEVVLSKLSYLKPVAKLSEAATKLFGRIWSRTVRLKLGYGRDSGVLRHNMEEILGKAPGNHQAHHIVGGAYAEGKMTTKMLNDQGIDTNSLMNGVFLPDCKSIGAAAIGAIHCGKHAQAYEIEVLNRLTPYAGNRIELVNELNRIREDLLSGAMRLNKH